MAIRKAVSADDFPEARESVVDVIGEKRFEEYKDIFPLLALTEYRVWIEKDINYIIARIESGDEVIPMGVGIFKGILHCLGSVLLFPAILLKMHKRPINSNLSSKMIVFSNTFVNSERYPSTKKLLDDTYGYRVIYTISDVIQYGHGSIKQSLMKSLKGNWGNYRPITMFASSVCGVKLKYYARKWCKLIYEYKNNGTISEAQIDLILPRLKSAYLKRLNKLKKRLKNNEIEMYATVNQYNLRDVLLIHACNDLGIRTVEMEHHVMQFSRINFSVENPMNYYSFAQENYTWNEADKRFHESVFVRDNILNKEKPIKIGVMGNLELTYEDACAAQEKYKMDRRITFMTSALQKTDLNTEEQIKQVKEWRWKIFNGLKELSERENIKVRIRYTPYREMDFREEEVPILSQWGFEISESVPACLLDDICSSMAVMSTTSTVLATARAFDRLVYRIEDPAVSYIKVDPGIVDVKVDDIATIVLPKDSIGNLSRNDFFRVEHLL